MRKQLSKKEIKELIAVIEENFGINDVMNKKDNVVKEDTFIKINNKILFFYQENQLIPTLKLIIELTEKNKLSQTSIKTITVDKGAIKFVINGADIMRPGITKISDDVGDSEFGKENKDKDKNSFNKGDFVVIVDETHKKPLAIGIALLNSEEIIAATSGKVIKNIHFVGDDVWKLG